MVEKEQHKKEEKHEVHHEAHHDTPVHHETRSEESKAATEVRGNPWMIAAIVFIVLSIVLAGLWYSASKGAGSTVVSQQDIGVKGVNFINTQLLQGQGVVTLQNVVDKGNLYEVDVLFENNTVPAYFTKDGGYFVGTNIVPLAANSSASTTPTTTPKEVPKSDKPVVQAFVFAYCPYGLQFEKAMIPVYNLLKSKADISLVYIGAMHGEFEHVESLRQLCIKDEYGSDKLWSYLSYFDVNTSIGSCSGADSCVNPIIEKIYTKVGIDKARINTCMNTTAPALYDSDGTAAVQANEQSSPGFMINGVDVQVNRTPEAIKEAICAAFNTAPAACNQTLSTAASTAGFGASAGTSSGATC